MIPVFRKGTIFYYDKTFGDLSWSKEEFFIASSFYATAINYNILEEEAYSLAYMYVMINKYQDMMFETTHMDKIKMIVDKVNKGP